MKTLTLLLTIGLLLALALFAFSSLAEDKPKPAVGSEGTVGIEEVRRIVLAQFPNARIREIELETRGELVYEVELTTEDGQKKEVHVNAVTGRIEKIEDD